VLRKNLASAKIVKIEFNANLDLLGFPHFITFKECRNCIEMNDKMLSYRRETALQGAL